MPEKQYSEFDYRVQLKDPFVLRHARRVGEAYCKGNHEQVQAIRQEFATLCDDDPATLAAFGQRCAEFAAG